jgi:prepilin-type N-terminal cleavage/methylation domain-containing protein
VTGAPASHRRRSGFTLWELTMVLLIMAITTALAVPALARLGSDLPEGAADRMLALLHDARKTAIDRHVSALLRIDPKTLRYQLDTTGIGGSAIFAEGTLELGMTQTLVTDLPRLQFLFRSSGAAFADTVIVHGGERPLTVRVDPWSGVARADSL